MNWNHTLMISLKGHKSWQWKKTYEVIISDKAKRMLGTHIKFIAQVNKEAARKKKTQLISAMRSLEFMPQRYPFLKIHTYHTASITNFM